jgi:LPS-assembly lipoprotein
MARRIVTAFAALLSVGALAGCGFQPLYGGAGYQSLPGLEIEASNDRLGYLVEDALRDYLGSGRSPYRVSLETSFNERPLGISAAGRARRFTAAVTARYVLTGPDGLRLSGNVAETIFYDAPGDPYALIAAKAAAEERAAERLGERLATEFATALQRVDAGLEP